MSEIDHPTTKPESSNDLTMTVEFRQQLTLRPPGHIEDSVEAKFWFKSDPKEILYDGIDVNQGEVEILEIDE
jgi:hypothetical protein